MAGTTDKLKNFMKQSDILTKLIVINVVVFIVLFILILVNKISGIHFDINNYVALPSSIQSLLFRPWTLLTYMFVHYEIFHILFNMLFLYSFGRLFLSFFSSKHLGSLYILGGLGGAVLFLLTYNLIPYFSDRGNSTLVGASASAMAIIFAVAFYNPNMKVNLMFIGKIKILYVALGLFALDFIFMGLDQNQGGHISHIGGALVGFIFAKQYLKGKDITKWMTNLIDRISDWFKPRAKSNLKVKYQRPLTDYEYNQRKASQTEEIDRILDKIKESGYSSLSKEEKNKLFDASKK